MNHAQRKSRSDAAVEFMIRQHQGLPVWSRSLSAVFHGKTMSDRRRFYFECRKRGVEVKVEKPLNEREQQLEEDRERLKWVWEKLTTKEAKEALLPLIKMFGVEVVNS